MDEVTIRIGGPGDVPAIRALTRQAYAKWVPLIAREPAPMTADYDEAMRRHRFDLLYVRDQLTGLIETVDEGEVLLIENVAIDPRRQGQGLGSRLMAHAEALARHSGKARVRLYTNARFAENIRLYRRLGYAVDGKTEIAPGTVRVDMSKALTKTP